MGDAQMDLITRLAREKQTSINLEQLYSFGLAASQDDEQQAKDVVLQAAQFLQRELPKRMSHRVVELTHLPEGMATMPSIQQVARWYGDSIYELHEQEKPTDDASELAMTRLLEKIYERHSHTLVTMARGVAEYKRSLGYGPSAPLPSVLESTLTMFLDSFYSSRIAIRTLIEQHIALHHPLPGHVGVINSATRPVAICHDAAEKAAIMCERELGESPPVKIVGDDDFSFRYIDSHIHHIAFEVLKNAFRAVVERHSDKGELPPVTVAVAADSSTEDVVIKVSDEGGGIPRSALKRVWSYFYTSSSSDALDALEEGGTDFSTATPLSGLGYGLPLSRVYARVYGGDMTLIPIHGFGTDAYIFLRRVGDTLELDPTLTHSVRTQLETSVAETATLGLGGCN